MRKITLAPFARGSLGRVMDEQKPTILYVEDEPLIALAVSAAFEAAGFAVLAAADSQRAVSTLEQQYASLAALVTDIRIPGGIDGWAVAHRARELEPRLAVVYVSGDSADDWPAEGVPNSLMLQKPFAEGQLVAAVTTLLNEAAKSPPS